MKFLLTLALLCSTLGAQDLQDWQIFTNMNNISGLSYFNGRIWASSEGGIYSFDPVDSTYKKYVNLNGLASLKISTLETDRDQYLLAATHDGIIHLYDRNFDLWRPNFDMQNEDIRDLHLHGDTLWVATDNGVGVYIISDMELQFRDFYNNLPLIPDRGRTIGVYAGYVFYGTDHGLVYASSDFIKQNLKISQNWGTFTLEDGMPSELINDLLVHNSQLYIGTNAGVAILQSDLGLSMLSTWTSGAVKYMAVRNDTLYFFRSFDYYRQVNSQWDYAGNSAKEITAILVDANENLWMGLSRGGIRQESWGNPFIVDGPASNHVGVVIRDSKNNLWMTSGKFKLYFNEGFYRFDGREWTNYRFQNGLWSLKNSTVNLYEDRLGRIWIGSWGGGVTLISDDNISFFHVWPEPGQLVVSGRNSEEIIDLPVIPDQIRNCLVGADVSGSDAYTVSTAFNEDVSGNMWIVNYFAREPKYVAALPTAGGTDIPECSQWIYFGERLGFSQNDGEISSIEFDASGRLWMGTFSRGLIVLDYNNTLDNFSDDRISRRADISTDNLFSNTILCVQEDMDQVIWIGTAGGLNSYQPDPSGFSSRFFKHVGEIGPIENKINHIFVDKYNNKWFSTDGGFSILIADKSPWDRQAWIHYTPENSGLPDKIVNSIYVDPGSGEAYIGTESGLAVFSGAFSEIRSDLSLVSTGPNPFMVDGQTVFTIKNLVPGATVKILTINGRLIRELTPDNGLVLGSRAEWDGLDGEKRKVASGIYLYLVYNEEGLKRTGKISVIRP